MPPSLSTLGAITALPALPPTPRLAGTFQPSPLITLLPPQFTYTLLTTPLPYSPLLLLTIPPGTKDTPILHTPGERSLPPAPLTGPLLVLATSFQLLGCSPLKVMSVVPQPCPQ